MASPCRARSPTGWATSSILTTSPSRAARCAATIRSPSRPPSRAVHRERHRSLPGALVAAQAPSGGGERGQEPAAARDAGCRRRPQRLSRRGGRGIVAPAGAAADLQRSAAERAGWSRCLHRRLFDRRSDPRGDAGAAQSGARIIVRRGAGRRRGRQAGPRDGAAAEYRRTPRQEAIRVLAEWPAAQPIPGVDMTSAGRLLIVGEAAAALGWAEKLRGKLEPTVLATTALTDADRPDDERYPVFAGRVRRLAGHLGAYTIEWETEEAAGATPAVRSESFDLVLDLCEPPLLRRVVLPDGYQAPGRDPLDQALAVIELLPLVGEFEKPQYVALQANLCAHSRATLQGCNNCIEVCATAAIVAQGDTVGVDPYLCQGCGTCATVCPSGALRYQYPRVADLGARLRALLAAYRGAGGEAACLLFHSATSGRELVDRLARRGALPARVIPLETWSADAVGIDLLLAAIAL